MTDAQRTLAQQRFLDTFRAIGTISKAAVAAGVSRTTVYNWIRNDRVFQESFKDAEEDVRDAIREELHRRAIEGVDEPIYQRGVLVGHVRKYSDAILLKMAAARLPEYRSLATSNQSKVPEEPGAPKKVVVEIVEVSDWGQVGRVKS
jgi:AcrR family transcriptional regulator